MGKKNKKEKKGLGKEKTQQKAEKNAKKRAKKELAEKGEDDIEKMIAEFQEKDKKKTQVIVEKCSPPSPRCNMSLTAHPDKDELLMFGGEYCTGKKMYMYNDLLVYNIKKNEWMKISAPNCPPPRSSHQAVATRQSGGQLWIFGGEFASPTQSQFYHYKDLWLFHLKDKVWEKINAPGGPSARSGHRMVQCKKQLIVFGGFHDSIRDYKVFNDVFAFNLDSYTWTQLNPAGIPPVPRSGCVLASTVDQGRVIVYGGYSMEKVKKDVETGKIHTDMFALTPEGKVKDDAHPTKWKWVSVKQSGSRPSQRSGVSLAVATGNKAFCFGGVFDEGDSEEQLQGKFYNTLYMLELDRGKWFEVELSGKRVEKKKRRKKKELVTEDRNGGGDENVKEEEESLSDESDQENNEQMEVSELDLKKLNIEKENTTENTVDSSGKMDVDEESSKGDNNCATEITHSASGVTMETEPEDGSTVAIETDESVFKVSVGPQKSTAEETVESAASAENFKAICPSPRMKSLMAVKNGILYLYGGVYEEGDKQFTLSDMYSLDINKMDEWNVIIESDLKNQEWDESESSSDEEMEDGAKASKRRHTDSEESESEDDDDEDDIDIDFSDAPERPSTEPIKDYFERTKDYWTSKAKEYCEAAELVLSEKKLEKLAKEMCQESFS